MNTENITAEICLICCENYNVSSRKSIMCPYCNYASCSTCCKTYILSQSVPKCMNTENCNREWSRQFLSQSFGKTFMIKTYKKHRENILMERERALLPATQPLVEIQIQKEQLESKICEEAEKIRELKIQIAMRYNTINLYRNEIHTLENSNKVQKQRPQFIRHCPQEECKGFLNEQWFCTICQKKTCSKCNCIIDHPMGAGEEEEKEQDTQRHVCKEEDILNAETINRGTKPCPGCGIGIFKIDGCNQMWCVQCHTAFNWNTGAIETNIHNPHYYEWMRRTVGQVPRTLGDIPNDPNACVERVLNHHYMRQIAEYITLIKLNKPVEITSVINTFSKRIYDITRNSIHLHVVIIPNCNYNFVRDNESLRIQYMRNLLTEEQFKFALQKKNKKYEYLREIRNLYDTTYNVICDILFRILEEFRKKTFILELMDEYNKEFDEIIAYSNACMADIMKSYNYTIQHFTPVLELVKSSGR